jgi:hypothetical protein
MACNSSSPTDRLKIMSVFLSPGLVVSPVVGESAINPYVGWHNQVAHGNVSADSEAAGYPVTNLANPSTVNRWRSDSSAEQLVTVTDLDGETDYVAIETHNLGSGGATVSVEAITAEPGAGWETVHSGASPADDKSLLLRFPKGFYTGVRLRIVPDAVPPYIAVLHVGELIVIPSGIAPGYTPINDGLEVEIVTGRADSGAYLGAIVTSSSLSTTTPLKLLPRSWFETVFRPFVEAANEGVPFFFAWSPVQRPDQVAYCWIDGQALPSIGQVDGSFDIDLPMRGVTT